LEHLEIRKDVHTMTKIERNPPKESLNYGLDTDEKWRKSAETMEK